MVGGVDEIHADVDGPVQHGDRLLLVGVAELALKRRTAVADGGDFQTLLAEKTVLHVKPLPAK